jgi:hypothetical protein
MRADEVGLTEPKKTAGEVSCFEHALQLRKEAGMEPAHRVDWSGEI